MNHIQQLRHALDLIDGDQRSSAGRVHKFTQSVGTRQIALIGILRKQIYFVGIRELHGQPG